jgi:hypothetical protein
VRVGGIYLNKARIRHALAAVLAVAASPAGFTVTRGANGGSRITLVAAEFNAHDGMSSSATR